MVFDVDVGRGCADEVPTPTPIEDDNDAKLKATYAKERR